MPGLTLCGVEFSRPNTACAISRASASLSRAIQPAQDIDPDLDVLPLGLADLTLGGLGQVPQVAVLDADQVGLAEREVEVEVDQPVQRGRGVGRVGDDGGRSGEQSGADPHQQLDQQRFLVGEVPVDRGPADPRGGADVLQPHGEKAALGDQPFGRGDELVAAVGLRPAAAGRSAAGRPGSRESHRLPHPAGGHFG